jgi:hypothetical protein
MASPTPEVRNNSSLEASVTGLDQCEQTGAEPPQ